MENKLQELTQQLYQEGVVKGNEEAEKIVNDARTKADEIIEKAKKEAESLINDAEKKATELDKTTRSELQMAGKQMISTLKQEVTNLINGSIINEAIVPATQDKAFIQKTIQVIVENWASNPELSIVVPDKELKAIEDYFAENAKTLLNNGLKIESAHNFKAGFQIGPADGSYKVSFTQEDFINFFKEFIRPKVVELLFDAK